MCGDIYIPMGEDTPEVILNRKTKQFSLRGQSLPEDSHAFYNPIITWLVEYVQQPFDALCFDIKLLYFNTSSAKEIAKILDIFHSSPQRDKITVLWLYDFHDPETIETCRRYELIPLHYEYYEYDYSSLEPPADEPEGTYHIIS